MKIVVIFGFALFTVSPAFAMDPTGVPQCDALLKRYEECSSLLSKDRVHAAQKELLEGVVSIRANAGDPKIRPDIERYCVEPSSA